METDTSTFDLTGPSRKAHALGHAARLAVTEAAHLRHEPSRNLAVGMALRAWTGNAEHVEGWRGPGEDDSVMIAAERALRRIRHEQAT